MRDDLFAFEPVDCPLRLTKDLAAARQVQFAVEAFRAGDYDAAVTLAGAAEGMLLGDPEIELSTKQIGDEQAVQIFGRKVRVQSVHYERDWLKHPTPHLPNELELEFANVAFPVYRAIRKLPLERITDEMLAFETWYRQWLGFGSGE